MGLLVFDYLVDQTSTDSLVLVADFQMGWPVPVVALIVMAGLVQYIVVVVLAVLVDPNRFPVVAV
jgi:hypothetical protein